MSLFPIASTLAAQLYDRANYEESRLILPENRRMNILFLDFDGVLNTERYQTRCQAEGTPMADDFGALFDPEAVGHLKMIVDAIPELHIVIESSWKIEGIDALREMWEARGLPGKIFDSTPDLLFDGLVSANLSDPDVMTRIEGESKVAEIRTWLVENVDDECNYVILDDTPLFSKEIDSHFIHVNPHTGITKCDALKVIELLAA